MDHLVEERWIDWFLEPRVHGLIAVEDFVEEVTTTIGIIGHRRRSARQSEKPDRPWGSPVHDNEIGRHVCEKRESPPAVAGRVTS